MMDKIKIKHNGVDTYANIVRFIELDDSDYLLYRFDGDENLYASKIVKQGSIMELHDITQEDLNKINDSNSDMLYLKEVNGNG